MRGVRDRGREDSTHGISVIFPEEKMKEGESRGKGRKERGDRRNHGSLCLTLERRRRIERDHMDSEWRYSIYSHLSTIGRSHI